jgi:hypothetical protein
LVAKGGERGQEKAYKKGGEVYVVGDMPKRQ